MGLYKNNNENFELVPANLASITSTYGSPNFQQAFLIGLYFESVGE